MYIVERNSIQTFPTFYAPTYVKSQEYLAKLAELAGQHPEGTDIMTDELASLIVVPNELKLFNMSDWAKLEFRGVPAEFIFKVFGFKEDTVLAFSMTDFIMRSILEFENTIEHYSIGFIDRSVTITLTNRDVITIDNCLTRYFCEHSDECSNGLNCVAGDIDCRKLKTFWFGDYLYIRHLIYTSGNSY